MKRSGRAAPKPERSSIAFSTEVVGMLCNRCGDVIYSRAPHDYVWCSCRLIAIDGGREYVRCTGDRKDRKPVFLVIDATEQELYDDWNRGLGKFGRIPGPGRKRKPTKKRGKK